MHMIDERGYHNGKPRAMGIYKIYIKHYNIATVFILYDLN